MERPNPTQLLPRLKQALATLPVPHQEAFAAICATRILKELATVSPEVPVPPALDASMMQIWAQLGRQRFTLDDSLRPALDAVIALHPTDPDDDSLSSVALETLHAVSQTFSIFVKPAIATTQAALVGSAVYQVFSRIYEDIDLVGDGEWRWQWQAIEKLKTVGEGELSPKVFADIPEYERGPRREELEE